MSVQEAYGVVLMEIHSRLEEKFQLRQSQHLQHADIRLRVHHGIRTDHVLLQAPSKL
jgi:hypothetical protein